MDVGGHVLHQRITKADYKLTAPDFPNGSRKNNCLDGTCHAFGMDAVRIELLPDGAVPLHVTGGYRLIEDAFEPWITYLATLHIQRSSSSQAWDVV